MMCTQRMTGPSTHSLRVLNIQPVYNEPKNEFHLLRRLSVRYHG